MWSEILHFEGVRLGINYGLNKVRFPSPVPVGSRIRAGATLVSVETVADGSLPIVVDFVVEREGAEKPCCVAQGHDRGTHQSGRDGVARQYYKQLFTNIYHGRRAANLGSIDRKSTRLNSSHL